MKMSIFCEKFMHLTLSRLILGSDVNSSINITVNEPIRAHRWLELRFVIGNVTAEIRPLKENRTIH